MHGTFFCDFPGFPGFPVLVGTLARGDRIILWTGKLKDRSRRLIGMTTINLGVICKLIFVFLPENIGVSVR